MKKIIIFQLGAILKARGLKVRPFAASVGLNYVTIFRICHNQTKGITLDMIQRICTALDILPGDLFTYEIIDE